MNSNWQTACLFFLLAATVPAGAQTLPPAQAAQVVNLDAKVRFDIAPQSMATALVEFSRQAKAPVVSSTQEVSGLHSAGVTGRMTLREALKALLSGTRLDSKLTDGGAIAVGVFPAKAASESGTAVWTLARAAAGEKRATTPSSQAEREISVAGIPEILVEGQRSSNADIRRTEDDPQPYVVFDREEIRRSSARSVEDFLKSRLPMNQVAATNVDEFGLSSNRSSINLRGLGANQTLILLNGRRLPQVNSIGQPGQPDINGVPLSSIERIEILPSTAGGIYGGGATGGVVNIITRRDYAGVDVNLAYDNTFDTDAGTRRMEANTGFSVWDTQVTLTASHSDSNPLLTADRDFSRRARALQQANNPSAFYTSTYAPLGYVTNIRSTNGANLQLDNGTVLGANFASVPLGYAGGSSDNGAGIVANVGRYNLDLAEDSGGMTGSLVNNPTVRAYSMGLRRGFGSRIEAFVDASYLSNLAVNTFVSTPNVWYVLGSASNNPFTNNLYITVPMPAQGRPQRIESKTRLATAGLIARLPGDWTGSLEHTRSRATTGTRFAEINTQLDPDGAGPLPSLNAGVPDGRVDLMRDTNRYPLDLSPLQQWTGNQPADTVTSDTTLRLSGPVLRLPAGPLALAGFAQRRQEKLEDNFQKAGPYSIYYPAKSQDANSFYLELRAPLVSAANARALVKGLELQLSARHDDFVTRASDPSSAFLPTPTTPLPALTYSNNEMKATKYTLALGYTPVEDLMFRASFGGGFLPPSVSDIVFIPTTFSYSVTAVDPKRERTLGTIGPLQFGYGGNPALDPEESRSFSAGVVLTPRALPGLRVSLDYTKIRKTNEIIYPEIQTLLDYEDQLPGFVTRAALTPADAARGFTGGVITGLYQASINLADTTLEAYDLQVNYDWTTALGRLGFYTVTTLQPNFLRRSLPTEPLVDSVGYTGGQLKLRGNMGLDWNKGPWSAGWNAQYYDSYVPYTAGSDAGTRSAAVLSQGSARIPSQTYHDVYARYDFGANAPAWLSNTQLTVGIQNALNKSPPIIAGTAGTEGYSPYGDPRLRRYSIGLRKSFQ